MTKIVLKTGKRKTVASKKAIQTAVANAFAGDNGKSAAPLKSPLNKVS